MDLITYFKSEFSPSGKHIRELMSFFAGEKEQHMLENIPDKLIGNSIGLQVSMWSDENGFFVQSSDENQKPAFGKTAFLAALEFQLRHVDMTTLMWGNPWIDEDRWRTRICNTDVNSQDGVDYLLTLLAELKLHQHLWVAHRKSDDYSQLKLADQWVVDSVGLLMKLFKYEVVLMLSRSTLFPGLAECADKLTELESRVATERFSAWHRFSKELTPDYKVKVRQVIEQFQR